MNMPIPATKPERVWLASYPPGVPPEVDWRATPSLKHLIERSCSRFADRPAFTSLGVSLTYREFDHRSRAFGAWLQRQGMAKGERVAVMLPNTLQYPIVVAGALRAGMTVVNINPLYTAAELQHQLKDSGATVVVVLENFAHTVQQARVGTAVRAVVVTQIGDLFPAPKRWLVNFVVRRGKHAVPPFDIEGAWELNAALNLGEEHPLVDVDVGPDDVAFIQYTGGTTGRPKGATLTHGNLVANVEQVIAWTAGVLQEGEETVITALPLYHVFALTANLLVFLRLGGHNVLIPDPRDMKRFISVLRRTPFTVITGVNTLFNLLMNAPGFDAVAAERRGHVKLAVAGGMALQPAVSQRWQQALGRPLIEGYGLSETSPIVCANRVDATTCSGKLGLPVPSTEVAILDDGGRSLPLGETGEICVRGPQVMRGYWNRPEETAQAITAEGWLRTGDIGRMGPDGYVHFVDRKKDMIVVSGMKAFPQEIDDVVRRLPGVEDVAAVGIPDERSGEAVLLFVVRRDPALTEQGIRLHCEQNLTAYKRPRRIEFRSELPRTAIGKVLRRQLKDEAMRAIDNAKVAA
ncbi:MAG TPA: AMP-binding protein [Ideonella sp.]|uniref:AMP-binding protein n=1 Tax=Ideonella sp. TaxID=1929293 RepID=UPI002E2EA59B|nr:AMP-binding protein [Ideonella sp.]HEX5685021.1 AMP-binding protein [Ideonella sp.]